VNQRKNYAKAVAKVNAAKSLKARQSAAQAAQVAGAKLQNAALAFKQVAAAAGIQNTAILNNAVASSIPEFRVDIKRTDVEFQAKDDVKVRTMNLPEQFDEKGNIKKYTKQELAELKGKDKNLPGYESSIEKLEVGQVAKVTLVLVSKKPATGDKETAGVLGADKKMQVKTIVILADADKGDVKIKKRKKKEE
jgi:hypothetical protein